MCTVDVEGMPLKDGSWDYSTVIEGVPLLLELFHEFDICSTFFVSSDVAENVTSTLKEITAEGHEIGCHGYNHQRLNFEDSEQQFRDLEEATKTIQAHLNATLVGFRAPFCRIDESTLPILIELGYKYDSSVVPSPKLFSKYYFPNAPHEMYTPSKTCIDKKGKLAITEIPISALPIIGLPLGLSYCMLFGLSLYKSLLPRVEQEVVTLYTHNYDFYPVPSDANVSSFFRLPYLKPKEQRIKMFRELLEFVKRKFSPTFLCAKEALKYFQTVNQQNLSQTDSLRVY